MGITDATLLAPMVILGGQRDLVFDTSIGPIGSVVFSSTVSVLGSQFTLDPITMQCFATCGVRYGFLVPMSHKVVRGTLSLTLNGVTETYDFRYQSAVPEPASLLLLCTGVVGGCVEVQGNQTQILSPARGDHSAHSGARFGVLPQDAMNVLVLRKAMLIQSLHGVLDAGVGFLGIGA
jgi:hypothetical protein